MTAYGFDENKAKVEVAPAPSITKYTTVPEFKQGLINANVGDTAAFHGRADRWTFIFVAEVYEVTPSFTHMMAHGIWVSKSLDGTSISIVPVVSLSTSSDPDINMGVGVYTTTLGGLVGSAPITDEFTIVNAYIIKRS